MQQVFIAYNSQTLQLNRLLSVQDMLTEAYRAHVEPLKIHKY